jgi:hypothetical protein
LNKLDSDVVRVLVTEQRVTAPASLRLPSSARQ